VLVIQDVLHVRRVGAVHSDASDVFCIANGDGSATLAHI